MVVVRLSFFFGGGGEGGAWGTRNYTKYGQIQTVLLVHCLLN